MIRDFDHKDPTRTEINADTVVMEDIVKAMVEFNDDLWRFTETAESRFATHTMKRADRVIELWELMRRGVKNERLRVNNERK